MMEIEKESTLQEVCDRVLELIIPSASERRELRQYSEHLVTTLTEELQKSGVEADVHIQGSTAKDTWLAGEKDIDIFISLPKTQTKNAFTKVLDVVKAFLGTKWVEAYAEHPYLKAEVGGYKIDFVPCFKIEWEGKVISSVDRTPLHTSYVKKHLEPQAVNDVRLLKQFMRSIGVYGAEIRVGGFSGYLCELLILNYSSFLKTLKNISQWTIGEVIDIENLYAGRIREVKQLFDAPLIVVDPVDHHRNVAAAVSSERLGELITATRIFLEKPRLSLFYPPTKQSSSSRLKERFTHLDFDVIVLFFEGGRLVPDVLWGQLYKSMRSLRSLLVHHGFQVLKTAAWSDEEQMNALIFGLESHVIPLTKRHLGPSFDSQEANNFLEKHVTADTTVIGPWIEGTHWVVGMKRRYNDAVTLLREKLKNGGKETGIANKFIDVIQTSLRIKVNEEIVEFAASNQAFAQVLTDFLSGKPRWLG
jgi:tRNA nucleotidyltransferase (CCA-adding enzyme)